MLVRYQSLEAAARHATFFGADEFARHQQVDSEGAALRLLADPGEIDVELLGRVGHGTEHAETAGIGDRGDHVTAVRESEDREVDSEQRGDSGLHRISPFGLSLMAGSLSRSPSPRVSSCLPVNGIAHRVRGTHGGEETGPRRWSDIASAELSAREHRSGVVFARLVDQHVRCNDGLALANERTTPTSLRLGLPFERGIHGDKPLLCGAIQRAPQ